MASLFGLILNPSNIAFDAFAKVTSVSVIGPTDDKIILGLIFSTWIFSIAFANASKEPFTSVFNIILKLSSAIVSPKISFF